MTANLYILGGASNAHDDDGLIERLNAPFYAELRARRRRKVLRILGLATITIAAAILLFGCGPGARQRALTTTFTAVNAARDGFVEFDARYQDQITDACVADGNEEAECQRRLDAYHLRRAHLVDGFQAAYSAIALAALDSHASLPMVLGVVQDAIAAYHAFRDNSQASKEGAAP